MTTRVIGGPLDVSGWLDPLAKSTPEVPCATTEGDLWFSDDPAELERAKTLCQDCPARLLCLAGALQRRESWGVWGGQIFVAGEIVASKRRRGRPRRADRVVAA